MIILPKKGFIETATGRLKLTGIIQRAVCVTTNSDQNTQIVTNIFAFMLQLSHSCVSTNQPQLKTHLLPSWKVLQFLPGVVRRYRWEEWTDWLVAPRCFHGYHSHFTSWSHPPVWVWLILKIIFTTTSQNKFSLARVSHWSQEPALSLLQFY